LINEQQLTDQFFSDVGLEVHDGCFHGLAKRKLPWPANSTIPDDALFDSCDEFIELRWGQSCSSLAVQWFLRAGDYFAMTSELSRRNHCTVRYDTPDPQLFQPPFA
jgi:hypothetical protein